MRIKRLLAAALSAALLGGLTTGCGETAVHREFFAMDTTMTLQISGSGAEAAADAVFSEINRLERLFSRTQETSELSLLGASDAPRFVDPELYGLLRAAGEYSAATGGAFDITIAPLADAWGFTKETQRVPSPSELAALAPLVGMEHLHLTDDSTVSLDAGSRLDLGGVAKGYASDRALQLLAQNGVESAMVCLGGNVYVRGLNMESGKDWRVGVRDPENASGLAGVLSLRDAFAITSGGYQRYFEEGGVRYHHILDPKTGCPAQSDLTSVTVVAPAGETQSNQAGNGSMCDAFSTALFVMGEAEAVRFWRQGAYDFDLVLITADGRVAVTEGLSENFEPEEGSGYAYETIKRSAS